jgi:hypothetical protein
MSGSATIRITKVTDPDAIARQVEPSIDNLTGNVAVRMRRLVPKRTYRLHDTIERIPAKTVDGVTTGGVRFGGRDIRGKYVGYHLHVEHGTSRMAAQPYARPALYQARSGDLVAKVVE